jgi:uncharacterized membrane protein YqjE
MNLSSDKVPTSTKETAVPHPSPCPNWRTALMTLLAARLDLIQIESKDFASELTRRGSWLLAASGCALFTWALVLVSGISIISQKLACPWDRIALGVAALHLLLGLFFARLAKPKSADTYPITRAEFKKDREWIENFQKTKKSND